MKAIGQSIAKANNDVFDNNIKRSNEDCYVIKENVVAISDGAGGIGIVADKWAKELLKNIPAQPFSKADDIDEWIGIFWEKFYNKYSKKLKDDL